MIRYQYADTSPVPAVGPMEDSAAQDWWGGAQRCMVGVAIATFTAASALSAQLAQQVTNGAQDDPQLAAPGTIQVEDDPGLQVRVRSTDWSDTVVSLWWDDSGPIEHVPTQEEVPPVFPAPSLWSSPRLYLYPQEEAVTPPAPLQVSESDWLNPVAPNLWVLPPVGLVPNVPDEWPTPVFPLPPDEDFWRVARPAWPWVSTTLYAFWQDERPSPATPLQVDEGEWRNPVPPQLWITPPVGLVPTTQDERPTPPPLRLDEGEALQPVVRPVLWLVPPVSMLGAQTDEWVPPTPPPTLHGLYIVNHTRERLRILNHSGTALRIVPHFRQGGRPVFQTLNPYADLEIDIEVFNRNTTDRHWEDTTGLSPVGFLSLTPTGVAIGACTVPLGAAVGDPNRYYGVIDTTVLQAWLLPTYANANIYLVLLIAGDDRRRQAFRVGGVGDFDS